MSEDNAAFTATIKAGGGYEAPWIVIRANTADELKQRLSAAYQTLTGPLVLTAEVFANEYSANRTAALNSGGGQPQQQNQFQPQAQTQAPAQGNAPQCIHGPMIWKEAKPGSGKTWKGHFCPSRDRSDQCDPVWPPKN